MAAPLFYRAVPGLPEGLFTLRISDTMRALSRPILS